MKLQEMMFKQFCKKIDLKQENPHVKRCLHISNKHCLIKFNYSKNCPSTHIATYHTSF